MRRARADQHGERRRDSSADVLPTPRCVVLLADVVDPPSDLRACALHAHDDGLREQAGRRHVHPLLRGLERRMGPPRRVPAPRLQPLLRRLGHHRLREDHRLRPALEAARAGQEEGPQGAHPRRVGDAQSGELPPGLVWERRVLQGLLPQPLGHVDKGLAGDDDDGVADADQHYNLCDAPLLPRPCLVARVHGFRPHRGSRRLCVDQEEARDVEVRLLRDTCGDSDGEG
mmetsp:Transcript_100991/g.283101  ORF Transcript_100991/g.283101 Transcript_100991/m.283101 type:complete len:229 (+) Transcript_100991:354-1040(+)